MNFPQPGWELIEHPHAEQRLAIAAQADYCIKWLKAQGFEVLSVGDGPRIIIRNCPLLCDQLEGAISGYSRGPQGTRYYKTVIRFDCEVRWIEGGAA